MVGVNGYTISSGVLSRELNDANIIAVPLTIDESMTIGWLKHRQVNLSPLALEYLTYLKQHIRDYGFDVFSPNTVAGGAGAKYPTTTHNKP